MISAVRLKEEHVSPEAGALIDRLEGARAVIESRFLAAGDVLSRAIDGVGALISALDGVTAALHPDAIEATSGALHEAADKLLLLPATHAANRQSITEMAAERAAVFRGLSDMRQSLAYMRAFTVNIKITAGGIASADAEFGTFAQDISQRIEAGRAEIDQLTQALEALARPLSVAKAVAGSLSVRCAELIPALPEGLLQSAELMRVHQMRAGEAAVAAADLARDVRKKASRVLAALQIGDITRQRIEHVQAGVMRLAEIAEADADQPSRTAALLRALMAAQLEDAALAFDREIQEIVSSMEAIARDAHTLTGLQDFAYGRGRATEGGGVLRAVERRLEAAAALVSEIRTAETEASRTGRATGEAAVALADRVAALQSIKSDVQYMALNTALKSSRIGEAGRPLGAIATELRLHAGRLEQQANRSQSGLEALSAAARSVARDTDRQADRSTAAEAEAVLAESARQLKEAGDRSAVDASRLAEAGEAVQTLLRQSTDRFRFKGEIGEALVAASRELGGGGGVRLVCEDDIKETVSRILGELGALYTMQQERAVQDRLCEAWGLSAPAAPAPANDPEDGDDILF